MSPPWPAPADAIGETEEFARCLDLLDDCDPLARRELDLARSRPGDAAADAAVWDAGEGARWIKGRSRWGTRRRTGRFHLDRGVLESTLGQDRPGILQNPIRGAVGAQMRRGHVPARNEGPHVQVVNLGHAVDPGQRGPEFGDIDVLRR